MLGGAGALGLGFPNNPDLKAGTAQWSFWAGLPQPTLLK